MIEQMQEWLSFLGWGPANFLAMLYGACAGTALAWFVKYPVRVYCDSKLVPVATFKWIIRSLAGIATIIGTELAWPVRGSQAWLAGILSWIAITLLYRYSAPILKKYAPWLSTDYAASKRADSGQDSGA